MTAHQVFIDRNCLDKTAVYFCLATEFKNIDWHETYNAPYADILISPNFELIMSWLKQPRFETAKIYFLTFDHLPTRIKLVNARTIKIPK